MADAYEVPVVSDGDHVVDMLNAVKLMTQVTDGTTSGQFSSIMVTVGLVGLIIVMINVVLRGNMNSLMQWLMAYALIWGVLFIPKVDVIVVDRTDPTVATNPVENVPLGVGMLAWMTTTFGDRVATSMETIMAPVDAVSYRGGNMLWGQKVMAEMPGMKMVTSRVSNNMNVYLRNCVFPTIAASPEKMQAIKTSSNLWAHLASNAPNNRMTEFTKLDGTNEFLSCNAAALLMTPELSAEATTALEFYGQRLFPDKDGVDARNALKADMGSLHSTFLGVSRDGGEMLKQVMMLNQFEKGLQGYANDTASASLMNFVESRAETQSRLTMSSLGSIMQTAMPRLYVLLFILLIAIFPFVIAMGLIPGVGLTVIKNYVYGFVYLQAFPVLFIIINRIIVVENQELASAAAKSSGGVGINLDNIGVLATIPSQTAAMAGVMLTLVPVLAGIFTKGVSTVAGQMNNVLRPMHVATESAAQEAATGNVSVGTTNTNTSNSDNVTSGQVMTSPNLDTNSSTRRLANGAVLRSHQSGGSSVNTADARSNMMHAPDFRETALQSISDSRSEASRSEQSAANSYAQSREQTRAQTMGLVLSNGMGNEVSENVGLGNNRRVNKSVEAARSNMERFAQDNNVSYQDLARAYAGAEAWVGQDTGAIATIFGTDIGGKATLGGQTSMQAQRAANLVKGEDFQDIMRSSQSLDNVQDAMSSVNESERFTSGSQFSNGYNNSLNNTQNAQATWSNASSKVSALDNMKSRVESNDASLRADLSQMTFDQMEQNLGYDAAVDAAAVTSNDSFSLGQQRIAAKQATDNYINGIMGGNLVGAGDVTRPIPQRGGYSAADNARVGMGFGSNKGAWTNQANQGNSEGLNSARSTELSAGLNEGREAVYGAALSSGIEGRGNPTISMDAGGNDNSNMKSAHEQSRYDSDAIHNRPAAQGLVDLASQDPEERRAKQEKRLSEVNNGSGGRRPQSDVVTPMGFGSGAPVREAVNDTGVINSGERQKGRGFFSGAQGLGGNTSAQSEALPKSESAPEFQRVRRRGPQDDLKPEGSIASVDRLGARDFKHANNAVMAAVAPVFGQSVAQDIEYGGLVFRTSDGEIGATKAIAGDPNHADGSRSFDPKSALGFVPKGATILGDYHTHGKNSSDHGHDHDHGSATGDGYYNEFSREDIRGINESGRESSAYAGGWLVDPEGEISFYQSGNLPDQGISKSDIEANTIKVGDIPDSSKESVASGESSKLFAFPGLIGRGPRDMSGLPADWPYADTSEAGPYAQVKTSDQFEKTQRKGLKWRTRYQAGQIGSGGDKVAAGRWASDMVNGLNATEAENIGQRIAMQHVPKGDREHPNYHDYSITSPVCNLADEGCSLEAVRMRMAEITPPQSICDFTQSDCTGEGDHNLFSGLTVADDTYNPYMHGHYGGGISFEASYQNPIVTWDDPSTNSSGNKTQPGHMFHKGDVIHSAFEYDGQIVMHTLGTGTANNGWLNEQMGPPLISKTHKQLRDEFEDKAKVASAPSGDLGAIQKSNLEGGEGATQLAGSSVGGAMSDFETRLRNNQNLDSAALERVPEIVAQRENFQSELYNISGLENSNGNKIGGHRGRGLNKKYDETMENYDNLAEQSLLSGQEVMLDFDGYKAQFDSWQNEPIQTKEQLDRERAGDYNYTIGDRVVDNIYGAGDAVATFFAGSKLPSDSLNSFIPLAIRGQEIGLNGSVGAGNDIAYNEAWYQYKFGENENIHVDGEAIHTVGGIVRPTLMPFSIDPTKSHGNVTVVDGQIQPGAYDFEAYRQDLPKFDMPVMPDMPDMKKLEGAFGFPTTFGTIAEPSSNYINRSEALLEVGQFGVDAVKFGGEFALNSAKYGVQSLITISRNELNQQAIIQHGAGQPFDIHYDYNSSPQSKIGDMGQTYNVPEATQLTSQSDAFDKTVAGQIGNTNFCEMDDLSRFQNFLKVQPVQRGMHDDFISERIADSWESLPSDVRNYEPTAKNVFGLETPYPGWVDDVGAHENNQRFHGGYHISTETGHPGVDVHFDAADPLRGPVQNTQHGYEVGLLKAGVIDTIHHPSLGAPLSDEGLAPNWDRYVDYCATKE